MSDYLVWLEHAEKFAKSDSKLGYGMLALGAIWTGTSVYSAGSTGTQDDYSHALRLMGIGLVAISILVLIVIMLIQFFKKPPAGTKPKRGRSG